MADDSFALMNMSLSSFCDTLSHQELLRALPIHAVSWYSSSSSLTFCAFSPPSGSILCPHAKKHRSPKDANNKTSLLTMEEQTTTSHSDHLTLIRVSCTTYRCLKPVCFWPPPLFTITQQHTVLSCNGQEDNVCLPTFPGLGFCLYWLWSAVKPVNSGCSRGFLDS